MLIIENGPLGLDSKPRIVRAMMYMRTVALDLSFKLGRWDSVYPQLGLTVDRELLSEGTNNHDDGFAIDEPAPAETVVDHGNQGK
jgi:hypothetical protein